VIKLLTIRSSFKIRKTYATFFYVIKESNNLILRSGAFACVVLSIRKFVYKFKIFKINLKKIFLALKF